MALGIGHETWCSLAGFLCVIEVHTLRLVCIDLSTVRARWPRPPPKAKARTCLANLAAVEDWHLTVDPPEFLRTWSLCPCPNRTFRSLTTEICGP